MKTNPDKFQDSEGNEITCANCSTTAREIYEDDGDAESNWFANPWYCSEECYDEATKYEG